MKKLVYGIVAVGLFVGGFFLGKGFNQTTDTKSEVAQETTVAATTTLETNNNQTTSEPKTLKEEQERNQQLVEKYIRTYLSTSDESLNELNNMQNVLSERVYSDALIDKRGQLKVNKVLNSNVLRVSLYQGTTNTSQFIVIAEVDSRDEKNKSRIVYPKFLVSVRDGIIQEFKFSLEND